MRASPWSVWLVLLTLSACGLDSGTGRGGSGGSGGMSGVGGAGGMSGGVAGSEACALPFEVGDCDAAIPVWAFVPALGACFPHIYGGCGGNDNRFSTQGECEQACGVGDGPGACPPNRIEREICVACGPSGGCITGPACAQICEDSCEASTAQQIVCFDGVCQVGGCI